MNNTEQTLALLKGVYTDKTLAKAGNTVTTSTGLVQYDLQAPSKSLYQIITLISKRIPRVSGRGGTATNWKAVTALTPSSYASMGWVPEGQRSGAMGITAVSKSASYVTIGDEAALTFEAQSAAEGFEDERSKTSLRLLQRAMRIEETSILGGNATLSLNVPTTPTGSAAGSGATVAAATYTYYVVALTFDGYLNSTTGAAGAVATSKTVTGQDGSTYNISGGSSNKSAVGTGVAVTLGQTLTLVAPAPQQGTLAWAWFVGTAGAEKLEAITTVPTAVFSVPLLGTAQAATAITANNSVNASLAFDGLLTTALNPANTAYVKLLGGATLTASSRGSVNEIDVMCKTMWDTYRLSPSVIYVNSQEQLNITNKVLNASSGTLLRQNIALGEPGAVIAGNVVSHYYNPFALNGGVMIPILLHPDVPPGTIIGWAENLPAQYQNNDVPNVAEMKMRRDWYEIEWPLVTRSYQHGIYCEGVLAVYAPFAMGVICGIGNG